MTPQFLRAEAARFREQAEASTSREASKQRLLKMAIDFETRAKTIEERGPTAHGAGAKNRPDRYKRSTP